MAILKATSESLDLTDDYTFTGKLSGHNYPAFEAYLSGNQEMSDTTTTKIEFNTERFDTDGYYDNSTNYRFTPLVAGKYFVYSVARFDGRTNSNLAQTTLKIYKNGAEYNNVQQYLVSNYLRQVTSSANVIIDMNGSTDYLEVFAFFDVISTGSGNPRITGGSTRSVFGAYRIGS